MKKVLTVISIVLLAISVCAYVGYNQYHKRMVDKVPPVIHCDSDTITVSVNVTDEELLQGVTASDDECGDVTDTIIIAGMSNFIAENTRIVGYTALDDSNNVATYERTLIYSDYKAPVFSLKEPLSFVIGSRVNIIENIGASSNLDGDLTQKIRYGLDNVIDNLSAGEYPIEFRVTDSCGKTSYLDTVIEIYDSSYSSIDVRLSDYLIYLPKGSDFNAESFYKGASLDGELTIVSDVNTKKPGTYQVDYFVNAVNISGKSRLTVVVTDN